MSHDIAPKKKLGYAEYVCYPNDGKRHEIIDGDHYMNPAPSTYHQSVSARLFYQLFDAVENQGLGRVFSAPTDVQLTDFDIVQPDIVVILKESERKITPAKIKGVPNLVVEILSPSTESNDLVLKKELYQRAGVSEYWVVDTEDQSLQQFALDSGRYHLQGKHSDAVSLTVLANAVIDLTRVW